MISSTIKKIVVFSLLMAILGCSQTADTTQEQKNLILICVNIKGELTIDSNPYGLPIVSCKMRYYKSIP